MLLAALPDRRGKGLRPFEERRAQRLLLGRLAKTKRRMTIAKVAAKGMVTESRRRTHAGRRSAQSSTRGASDQGADGVPHPPGHPGEQDLARLDVPREVEDRDTPRRAHPAADESTPEQEGQDIRADGPADCGRV